MTGYGKRPRNMIYIVSQRRSITGNKIKNAKNTYAKLLRREQHEGLTLWIIDAKKKAEARLRMMGLSSIIKQA